MAAPRFRSTVLVDARLRANLTQLQLAARAVEATSRGYSATEGDLAAEQARRIRTWESRIGAWERGIDAPSAPYLPIIAQLLDLEPLSLFAVDPVAPPFTALRLSKGLTLQTLSQVSGVSYTSLHRMVHGVTTLPEDVARRIGNVLGVTQEELAASIARER